MTRNPLAIDIRKLRKKLRQIENLEKTDRDLTDDELLKVSKKHKIRTNLQSLLALAQDEEQEEEVSMVSSDAIDVTWESSMNTTTSYNDVSIDNLSPSYLEEAHINPAEPVSSPSSGFPDYEKEVNNEKCTDEVALEPPKSPPKRPLDKNSKNPAEDTKKRSKKEEVRQKKADNFPEKDIQPTKQKFQKLFKDKNFSVMSFDGHNDLVTSVDTDGQYMISGSRDTTLRYWNMTTGEEKRSFGGHTGTITCVALLDKPKSKEFCTQYKDEIDLPLEDEERIAITGSTDCSIKIWALESGQMLKSIYTFNPITCLLYLYEDQLILTSTAGGKIDMWNPHSGQNVFSTLAHQDSITCLKKEANLIFSSSTDGEIQISEYSNSSLRRLYISEVMKLKSGGSVLCRPIKCLASHNDNVYYGDDGSNVKVLDWKKGEVDKLSNHLCEFGSTDAAFVSEGILYTTGYDLDHGLGYINCRNASTGKYMGTLCDEVSGCILCLCCTRSKSGKSMIVSAGTHLNIWLDNEGGRAVGDSISPYYIKQYDKPARHSDIESDGDSDSDGESSSNSSPETPPFKWNKLNSKDVNENVDDRKSWLSWCNIL